jgi:hypothetical protein
VIWPGVGVGVGVTVGVGVGVTVGVGGGGVGDASVWKGAGTLTLMGEPVLKKPMVA